MQPNIATDSIETFIDSIKSFSFQEKYFKWQDYVKALKK